MSLYKEDPDSGVHGAAEWVLRKWGFENQILDVKNRLAGMPRDRKGWFITPKLHTMIVVSAPGSFTVGSPIDERDRDKNEGRHEVAIHYSFAISAHEVTFAQFRESRGDVQLDSTLAPSEECPKMSVSWSAAAGYCNWLTEKLGMQEGKRCYPTMEGERAGARLPDDFLSRPGVRLPTIHEWEYVARAGAMTSRFFGNADSDLDKYAWFSLNSSAHTWPVGRLRPNPLGLFDIYGNVSEWCEILPLGGTSEVGQVRGGGYRSTGKFLRSAMPEVTERENQFAFLGFRIAMTLLKP